MSRVPPVVRLVLGLVVAIGSFIPLAGSQGELLVRRLSEAGMPLTFMAPSLEARLALHGHDEEELLEPVTLGPDERLPGVIVAHGFAGSKKLMYGYGLVLAKAGYAVLLLDFSGHGLNPAPLDRSALQEDLDRAYRVLLDQGEVDPSRVALVGHSMGAGAVLAAGVRDPDRYSATVAISPADAPVTGDAPRNLQLQAGAWETPFLLRAQRLFEEAGGGSDDFAAGGARSLVTVPRAEHLSILFRDASQQPARQWLDRTFGTEGLVGEEYRDRRILWWLVHLAGWLILLTAMASAFTRDPKREKTWVRRPWNWAALVAGPVAAPVVCAGLASVMDIGAVGGMAVGGALALWLLIAGGAYLGGGFRPPRPQIRQVAWGVGLFGVLWLILGASADFVWLEWGLVGRRLALWPLLALSCLPWFLAVELAQGDPGGLGRFRTFLLQTVVLLVGLIAAANLVPGLGLIALIVPLVPLYVGCLTAFSSRVNEPWAVGIGCALFFGWLLACSFPLVGSASAAGL